jgi:RNase H-like domain found in reverse transcriptase
MISAPVLVIPDFEQSFTLEINASEMGIGAVLIHTLTRH